MAKRAKRSGTEASGSELGSDAERKDIAVKVAQRRFPGLDPDVDISSQLDEPGEKVATAHFLNGPIADWVVQTFPKWRWILVWPQDFDTVTTVRDFAWLCYRHLTPLPTPPPAGAKPPDMAFDR